MKTDGNRRGEGKKKKDSVVFILNVYLRSYLHCVIRDEKSICRRLFKLSGVAVLM